MLTIVAVYVTLCFVGYLMKDLGDPPEEDE